MKKLKKKKFNRSNKLYCLEFYNPDSFFYKNLKFKCSLYFPESTNNKFNGLFKLFTKIEISYKFIIFLLFFLGTGLYMVNLNGTSLNNDFILSNVYAQNTQTNLMPLMMLSSNFNSKGKNPGLLNPATIPLAKEIKTYNFGHIGYELRKGEALNRCLDIYPFPEDIIKVEAYEFIDSKGEMIYKVFGIGSDGKWEKYIVLENGQLVKIESSGELKKAQMNHINTKLGINDIIGQLPKTINIEKKNSNYLLLKWNKKVLCNNEVEDMIINVLVDSISYKIKTLSTYLDSNNSLNLLYSMEFVSDTSNYDYEDVKSNFELNSKEEELLLL